MQLPQSTCQAYLPHKCKLEKGSYFYQKGIYRNPQRGC